MINYLEKTGYPTLPFALVFQLARLTEERAQLGNGRRMVGIHAHHDRSITSMRVEIQRDEQLPEIEARVAEMIGAGPIDTLTLTHSTQGEETSDFGIIFEKGKDPKGFIWIWGPRFGMELVEAKDMPQDINTWSGVELARNLMNR